MTYGQLKARVLQEFVGWQELTKAPAMVSPADDSSLASDIQRFADEFFMRVDCGPERLKQVTLAEGVALYSMVDGASSIGRWADVHEILVDGVQLRNLAGRPGEFPDPAQGLTCWGAEAVGDIQVFMTEYDQLRVFPAPSSDKKVFISGRPLPDLFASDGARVPVPIALERALILYCAHGLLTIGRDAQPYSKMLEAITSLVGSWAGVRARKATAGAVRGRTQQRTGWFRIGS